MGNYKKLVIIPCYNEEKTIKDLVVQAGLYADICIVDDGSCDRTPEILKSIENINIITHLKNTHIPGALCDGMAYALDNNYDYAVTMDAGFSHDPAALPFFFKNTGFDCVIGARNVKLDVPVHRRLISWMASRVVNFGISDSWIDFKGPAITDCTSGYRMYSKRAMQEIISTELRSVAFDFHMEALAILCRKKYSVEEIPITYTFSNSSFNFQVFKYGMAFGLYLLKTKAKFLT